MYLLYFLQNGLRTDLAIFNSIESGREFAKKIPSYNFVVEKLENVTFEYETIDPDELPIYLEIEHNGNIIPISRYMFTKDGLVELVWMPLINLDTDSRGMLDSSTIVDAYLIDNNDLEEYIEKREQKIALAINILENLNYRAERSFFGSEDGEAIIYKKEKSDRWYFLTHADPLFVRESPDDLKELKDYIIELISSN